jgi:hypothetical protein
MSSVTSQAVLGMQGDPEAIVLSAQLSAPGARFLHDLG